VKKRGVKRTSDAEGDAVTPVKKARGARAGKAKKEVKEEVEKGEVEVGESDGDALEGVEEGMDGAEGMGMGELPLGREIKVENGVITVRVAGEED